MRAFSLQSYIPPRIAHISRPTADDRRREYSAPMTVADDVSRTPRSRADDRLKAPVRATAATAMRRRE